MNINHPSVTLYFVFAFTYCTLTVYKTEERFVREVLLQNGVEFLEKDASNDWQTVDTRLLLSLVATALPKLMEDGLPNARQLVEGVAQRLQLKPK